MYGLKQATKSFFDKLTLGLTEPGFKQSNVDKCLFIKKDMVCVVYVNDTIIAGSDPTALEDPSLKLGIVDEEQRYAFEIRDEGGRQFFRHQD